MGLFRKKKPVKEVRPPVEELDVREYVKLNTTAKPPEKRKMSEMATEKKAAEKTTEKTTEKKTATKATEKKTVAKTAEKKETAAKTTEKKEAAPKATAAKKTEAKPAKADKKDTKTWHITKNSEMNKWQVKAEENTRVTKYFNTKAEAEEFVKTLLSNNEGSKAVAHKKDGKFQKS